MRPVQDQDKDSFLAIGRYTLYGFERHDNMWINHPVAERMLHKISSCQVLPSGGVLLATYDEVYLFSPDRECVALVLSKDIIDGLGSFTCFVPFTQSKGGNYIMLAFIDQKEKIEA